MNNREELIKWGIKMHNLVNKELGKIYNNEEVINDIIIEKDCNLSKNNKTNIFFKIVIAIIIVWILLYLYKNNVIILYIWKTQILLKKM